MSDQYQKRYRATMANKESKSVKATLPYEFVERQARRKEVAVEILLATFDLVAHYDDSDTLTYTFEPAAEVAEAE